MNPPTAIRSLEEVGQILGLDRRAVWYLEKKAFNKLRRALERRLFDDKYEVKS